MADAIVQIQSSARERPGHPGLRKRSDKESPERDGAAEPGSQGRAAARGSTLIASCGQSQVLAQELALHGRDPADARKRRSSGTLRGHYRAGLYEAPPPASESVKLTV